MCRYATSACQVVVCLALLICGAMATSTGQSAGVIHGTEIDCKHEGRDEFIPGISEDPCISCKCQNRVVACKRDSCPHAPTCYFLLLGKRQSCCESCKGCDWQGTFRANGDTWTDPANPCVYYNCQSGVLTSTKVQCHTPCRHATPPTKGQCCPQCPSNSCKDFEPGKPDLIRDSQIETDSSDPCVQCSCQLNGQSSCWKQACPVLPCPPSRQAQKKGQCCPQCRGSKKGTDIPGKCDLGLQVMQTGQRLTYDLCTECSCNGSTTICQRTSCPSLECPFDLQVHHPDLCCPRCRGQEEQQQVCSFRGKVYRDGDTWKLDKCSRCECRGTKVHCEFQDCSKLPPCPPRFQLKTLPGECCPTCVEEDAVCSAFGETHYKTFDGRMFHFQGSSCRYLLTRDCSTTGTSFAINIVNDAKNKGGVSAGGTNSGPTPRSVILKIENTKIQLTQNLRVKFGRKRVRLPFVHLGVLSITMENQTVVIRTNIGIKLLWDAESYLELSVPTQFKGKLCGLCGNYNGDPNDDFRSKKGQIVTDPFEFAQSWQSGKKSECRQKTNVQSISVGSGLARSPSSPSIDCGMSWESRNRARRECSIFKQSVLSTCQATVNPSPYFHSCMMDVCECRQSKKCHCQTIKAYARECERSGLTLTNWKNATNCENTGANQQTQCPTGSAVTPCGLSCRKTCKNHHQNNRGGPSCRRKACQPGCECTGQGKVWHRHKCINPNNCPPVGVHPLSVT